MKRIICIIIATVIAAMLFSSCASKKTVYTGLGVTSTIKSSVSAANGKDGTAQVDTAVAAITLDSNGIIEKLTIDAPQTRVVFNNKGKITSGLSLIVQSKLEKGDNYGMGGVSAIGKEWYEQIAAFEQWAIGKTVDEVLGLKTVKVDETRPKVPDAPELTSSVTITVGDYMKAIEKAAANAVQTNTAQTYKTGLGIITKINNSADAAADKDGYAQVDSMMAVVTLNDNGKIAACSIDTAQTKVPFDISGELSADFAAEIQSAGELGGDYARQMQDFAAWTIGKTVAEIKKEAATEFSIDTGDFIAAIEKAVANGK